MPHQGTAGFFSALIFHALFSITRPQTAIPHAHSDPMDIFKSFTFEAAHHLAPNVTPDHRYARLHGHSFAAEIYLSGTPDPNTGWIVDFGELDEAIAALKADLDHGYLNDLDGLDHPTLENISVWVWNRLAPQFSALSKVIIRRGSCGEGCIYTGPER
jgi:6-pyruvoyltetrahydropterin/6-carboxytetrahydropterin synthase